MPMYIVPLGNISAESAQIITRSEIPILTDGLLIDKLIKASEVTQSIVQLNEDEITTLLRGAAHLTKEAPVVLTAVPGLQYRGTWSMVASRLHPMDWLTLEATLTKAGFTANDSASLQERALRDSPADRAGKQLIELFADDDDDIKPEDALDMGEV